MVKEQHKKVTTARAAGDTIVLHQARFVFLGTVTAAAADTGVPTVVSAGLFYPRWCSKDGAEMPHMYVELLCCNSPGRGYGSILLSHIEQFTAAGADYLSAAFAGCTPSSAVDARAMQQGCAAGGAEHTAAVVAGSTGVSAVLPTPVVLPLLAEGMSVPADPLSSCCTACGSSADGSASSASSASIQMVAAAELSCATSAVSAPGGVAPCTAVSPAVLNDSIIPAVAVATDTVSAPAQAAVLSAAAPAAAAAAASVAKRIRGVKLLSVESARSFYERHGYGQPDACREMFKPLLLLPPRDVAGSASSSSICSMMSVSSSSSNVVC
jgi:hypothetical protein